MNRDSVCLIILALIGAAVLFVLSKQFVEETQWSPIGKKITEKYQNEKACGHTG